MSSAEKIPGPSDFSGDVIDVTWCCTDQRKEDGPPHYDELRARSWLSRKVAFGGDGEES